ncbi:hypothetical protein [Tomitella gaofuii]|uniref:hypothetical protein n=1 Tax=Tomitella gaofuii TaxID=2760083 RepID=UPI0015FAFD2B|nr:hypothetical protein [Tomitella gaofuii]
MPIVGGRRSLPGRAVVGCALSVLLAACGSSTTADGGSGPSAAAAPDISQSGRMDYACALVRDLPADGSVFDPEAGSAVGAGFAGAVRLFGALTGSHVPGYESLSAHAVDALGSTTTLDIDGVDASITAMADDCAARGLPEDTPDVSRSGRVDYACALIADARAGDYPLGRSNFAVHDEADPTLTAVAAAAGLIAGPGPVGGASHLDGTIDEGLDASAATINEAIPALDFERLNSGIDALATGCAQR